MRKQELVHLHTLCALVRDHVETRGDVSPDAFSRYENLGVSPSAIYRDKRAHRHAVQRLAADVATALDEPPTSAPNSPVADGGATNADELH